MLQAERGRARYQLIVLTAVHVHIWLRLRVACNNANATPLGCPVLAVVPYAYDNSCVTPLSVSIHTHTTFVVVDQVLGSSGLKLGTCDPRDNILFRTLETLCKINAHAVSCCSQGLRL